MPGEQHKHSTDYSTYLLCYNNSKQTNHLPWSYYSVLQIQPSLTTPKHAYIQTYLELPVSPAQLSLPREKQVQWSSQSCATQGEEAWTPDPWVRGLQSWSNSAGPGSAATKSKCLSWFNFWEGTCPGKHVTKADRTKSRCLLWQSSNKPTLQLRRLSEDRTATRWGALYSSTARGPLRFLLESAG